MTHRTPPDATKSTLSAVLGVIGSLLAIALIAGLAGMLWGVAWWFADTVRGLLP